MSQLILLNGTDWWAASWFGLEANGLTARDAMARLASRIRDARFGLGPPVSEETFDAIRGEWPEIRDAVAVMMAAVPEPARESRVETEIGPRSLAEARALADRHVVARALSADGGNITRAARRLGISRFGLQKMARRLGVPAGRAAR